MNIYKVHLRLQDPLYFATRELGRLYATERYLHNYALTYALGLARSGYHDLEHIPHYQEDLEPLNSQNIYVSPAQPVISDYVTHTYKWAKLRYHIDNSEQTSKNIPTFGRIRELAPESQFRCFIISQNTLNLPRWIRLGKWMSKAEVTTELLLKVKRSEGEFVFPHPLNPLDVMFSHQILSYDTVNMPPVSLIRNVRIRGQYYESEGLRIPACMSYRFRG
jgi:CRISPR-associated protein Csc1